MHPKGLVPALVDDGDLIIESIDIIRHLAGRNDALADTTLPELLEMAPQGLRLTELAPGIDLERDTLGQMEVRPVINEVVEMDRRIFCDREMDLRLDLLHLDLPDRIARDAGSGQLFLNFEKMRVRTKEEVDLVGRLVEEVCAPLDRRVDVIVNYDGFRIDEALEADWARMVAALTERYYAKVSRYSGSAFMRMKLGRVFPEARSHIFETAEQARGFLDGG